MRRPFPQNGRNSTDNLDNVGNTTDQNSDADGLVPTFINVGPPLIVSNCSDWLESNWSETGNSTTQREWAAHMPGRREARPNRNWLESPFPVHRQFLAYHAVAHLHHCLL